MQKLIPFLAVGTIFSCAVQPSIISNGAVNPTKSASAVPATGETQSIAPSNQPSASLPAVLGIDSVSPRTPCIGDLVLISGKVSGGTEYAIEAVLGKVRNPPDPFLDMALISSKPEEQTRLQDFKAASNGAFRLEFMLEPDYLSVDGVHRFKIEKGETIIVNLHQTGGGGFTGTSFKVCEN